MLLTGILQAGLSLRSVRVAEPPLHPELRGSLWPKGGVVLAPHKPGGGKRNVKNLHNFTCLLPAVPG